MLIYSKAVEPELALENMEEVAAKYDSGVKVSKHSATYFTTNGCYPSLGRDWDMESPVPDAVARAGKHDGASRPFERLR